MQQVGSMTFGDGIIGAAASGLVGWLAASVTKVSKADHEKAVQQAAVERQRIIERLDALEKDVTGRMTRAEFGAAFGEVKAMVSDFRKEAREEFKDLKNELKTKT